MKSRFMIGLASVLFASLAASASAGPLNTQAPGPPLPTVAPAVTPEAVAEVSRSDYAGKRLLSFMKISRAKATKAGFSGEFGMAYLFAPGTPVTIVAAQDGAGKSRPANRLWRWASVTKQVVAVLVMQEVASGRINLDAPVARYLPQFASPNAAKMTVRQLLRHQSGLPNPDDTPIGADGVPEFYRSGSTTNPLAYCAGPVSGEPGGNWTYNNCDYIVAADLLEKVTGMKWTDLVQNRIAEPFNLTTLGAFPTDQPTVLGFIAAKPEPAYGLERFGGAGALYGSMSDLLKFDLALQQGKLLPSSELAQMWDGKPEMGSIALGQWSFTAPLSGCSAPVRIIERRGAIGGVQVRNFILPELGIASALFTDQAEFEFGEVWQGSGFSFEMLSLAACPQGAA